MHAGMGEVKQAVTAGAIVQAWELLLG